MPNLLNRNYADTPKRFMDLQLSCGNEVGIFVEAYPNKVFRVSYGEPGMMILELHDVVLPQACVHLNALIVDIKADNLSPYVVCSETAAVSSDKDYKYRFFTPFTYVPNLQTNDVARDMLAYADGGIMSKKCLFTVIPNKLTDKQYLSLHTIQLTPDYTEEPLGHLRLKSDESNRAINKMVLTSFYDELNEDDQLDVLVALDELSRSSIRKVTTYSTRFNSGVKGWSYYSQGARSLIFRKGNLLARLNTNDGFSSLDKDKHQPYDVLTAAYFSLKTGAKFVPRIYGCHGNVSVVELLDIKTYGEDLGFSEVGRQFILATMEEFFSEMAKWGTRVEDLHLNNFGQTKDGSMKVFDLDNWCYTRAGWGKPTSLQMLREAKFYSGIVESDED